MARIVCWLSLDIPVINRRSRIDAPTTLRSVFELGHLIEREIDSFGGVAAQQLQIESSALGIFESVQPALECAFDLQLRLVAQGWPARIVLFVAEQSERDVVDGLVLSRAELLRVQALEGSIFAESTTASLAGDEPMEQGRWATVGPSQTTSDLLVMLEHPELPTPQTDLGNRRGANNLPRRLTALIGREADVAGVTERFYLSRLVTVTGPGGIGKSRVTIQSAYDMLERQPDGVWWHDCRTSTSPNALAESLLSVLPRPREGEDSPLRRLQDTLRQRELLIVLDNAEESLEHVAVVVEEIGESCPNVAFLISSRKPLKVVGESVYRLGTLPSEGPDAPAVQMFLSRIRLHHPEFEPSSAQFNQIRSVCRALDGFPLAIEIAAAQHPDVSLAQIERRVTQGMLDLKLKRKGMTATLDAVVGWGYETLRPGDQAVLRAVSVFPDRFTVEMAGAVASKRNLAAALQRLSEASLLEHDERGYGWLTPIRAVAARELRATGGEDRVRQLACAYLITELESYYEAGRPFPEWIRTCDLLHTLAFEALGWLMKGPIRDDTAFRIVYGLYDYWYSQGRFAEGETMARRLLSKSQSRPTFERIRLFNVSGILRMQQGEHRDAAIDLHHGLELARQIGGALLESKMLCNYALALCRIPRLEEALVAIERACDLWPEHGDLSVHCFNLLNAANVQLVARDFEGALATVGSLREIGVPAALQANTDLTEASLLGLMGQNERAQPVLESVLLQHIEAGNTRHILITLRSLVSTLAAQGLFRQAATVSGLVDQLQLRFTVWMAPCNVELYSQSLDQCRAALGDAFESEVEIGRDVTIEEFGDFLRRRGAPSLESIDDER